MVTISLHAGFWQWQRPRLHPEVLEEDVVVSGTGRHALEILQCMQPMVHRLTTMQSWSQVSTDYDTRGAAIMATSTPNAAESTKDKSVVSTSVKRYLGKKLQHVQRTVLSALSTHSSGLDYEIVSTSAPASKAAQKRQLSSCEPRYETPNYLERWRVGQQPSA